MHQNMRNKQPFSTQAQINESQDATCLQNKREYEFQTCTEPRRTQKCQGSVQDQYVFSEPIQEQMVCRPVQEQKVCPGPVQVKKVGTEPVQEQKVCPGPVQEQNPYQRPVQDQKVCAAQKNRQRDSAVNQEMNDGDNRSRRSAWNKSKKAIRYVHEDDNEDYNYVHHKSKRTEDSYTISKCCLIFRIVEFVSNFIILYE